MCTALIGITLFTYLATWTGIIYYMVHRNRHVIIPTLLIIVNVGTTLVGTHSTCHIGYDKAGAATTAVLLLILAINVSDSCSARYPPGDSTGDTKPARTARADQQEAGGMEETTRRNQTQRTDKG